MTERMHAGLWRPNFGGFYGKKDRSPPLTLLIRYVWNLFGFTVSDSSDGCEGNKRLCKFDKDLKICIRKREEMAPDDTFFETLLEVSDLEAKYNGFFFCFRKREWLIWFNLSIKNNEIKGQDLRLRTMKIYQHSLIVPSPSMGSFSSSRLMLRKSFASEKTFAFRLQRWLLWFRMHITML